MEVRQELEQCSWDEPWTCSDWFDEWSGYTYHSCFEGHDFSHTLSGWASSFVF